MNSQRTENEKNKAASTVFTKETLGVVAVLFTTLCLICLITKDAVFSVPGKAVCDFLMGVFGYFAFPVTIFALVKGVMLVIDKKSKLSFKRKILLLLAIICVALFAHIVSMGAYDSYAEYFSASYSRGDGVYSAGGVVAGAVAFFLQALLTVVGSAVVLGVLTAICTYFLVKDFVKGNRPAGSDREFRSTFVKNEDENAPASEESAQAPVQPAVQTAESATATAFSATNAPKTQKLFINNGEGFSYKSKREMKETGSAFQVDSSVGTLNVSGYAGSYADAYSTELQKKIEYVKTPAKITVDKIIKPDQHEQPDNGTRVSDYIAPREDADDNSGNAIPMIEHERSFTSDAKSRAEAFGERYADNAEISDDEKPATPTFMEEERTKADEVQTEEQRPIIPETDDTPFEDNSFENNSANDYENPVAEDFSPRGRGEDLFKEPAEEKEDEIPDTPPVTRMREGRARDILFENDKPSFTSRAEADGNAVRDFITEEPKEEPIIPERARFTAEEPIEPIKEEKPAKPPVPINRTYYKPPLDLLETHTVPVDAPKENHEERIEIIRQMLEEFHISVEPQGYVQGPTVTRYEVKMPAGVSVKRVIGYDDDLKMRLMSKEGVRIEAPIPGKNLVGIEVANTYKKPVGLREVLEGAAGQKIKPGSLMFALGKDIVGDSKTDNLAKGPHYLVAGATGSGKSVCLNVMIISMIMRYSPEELRLILVDPKRVGFKKYEHLPHLMIDEIVTEPLKAVAVLKWAQQEMERRYSAFENVEGGLVSDIESYNEIVASDTVPKMPRIVIVVDELADLMETCKKDMETYIRMLSQKARAAGIHLVLATQRPSVDVVTGTIKANLPSRIALKVMNFQDSNTILSEGGAEKLLGNGDMLYKNSGMPEPERYQGAYVSDREISNVVNYIKEKNAAYFDDDLQNFLEKAVRPKQEESTDGAGGDEDDGDGVDELFRKALWLAVTSNSVSISQLQRRFQIGYSRAGGLVDKMERMGFVSANEGSKARKVLISREEFEQKFGPMSEGY